MSCGAGKGEHLNEWYGSQRPEVRLRFADGSIADLLANGAELKKLLIGLDLQRSKNLAECGLVDSDVEEPFSKLILPQRVLKES